MNSYLEIKSESQILERVGDYLIKDGWKLYINCKIRGKIADIIAEKDGKLAIIEIKGKNVNPYNGIQQVLHFKKAVNYAYLAIPDESITDKKIDICKELGIGLIAIGIEIKQVVKPELTKALESVKNIIFQKTQEKPKIKKRGLLETLFRTKTLVDILNILFLNQTREYYLNELAREAKVSAPTALRELEKIQPLNIIIKTKKKNGTFYRINIDSIIYKELKQIFLKFELTDEIISKGLEKFDIKYALIFGSFAKNTETDASDIDVLVIGNIDKTELLLSVSKLEAKIGREINVIVWSEDEFKERKRLKISLLENIKENEIIMIRGDENEFR